MDIISVSVQKVDDRPPVRYEGAGVAFESQAGARGSLVSLYDGANRSFAVDSSHDNTPHIHSSTPAPTALPHFPSNFPQPSLALSGCRVSARTRFGAAVLKGVVLAPGDGDYTASKVDLGFEVVARRLSRPSFTVSSVRLCFGLCRQTRAVRADSVVSETVFRPLQVPPCLWLFQTQPKHCKLSDMDHKVRAVHVFDKTHTFLVLACLLANVTQFRPAGVHGWLQVAAIETAVSETDIFASSTCFYNIITLHSGLTASLSFAYREGTERVVDVSHG